MKTRKICCGCGKEIKKGDGHTTTMLSAKGMGRKYYYNCGCLDRESFMEITRLLFLKGGDKKNIRQQEIT